MKHMAIFRLLSMLTILFYSTAFVQAGQVISKGERAWAKAAVQQKKTVGAINTPNSIAVLYFINKSGQDNLNPLQKGMAVMLSNDLAKLEQLQVVSRVRIQALLDEMGLGISEAVDTANVSTIARLLDAYFVSSGDIQKGTNQSIIINSSVLDIPFETLNKQPAVVGTVEQLYKMEKKILFNIVDQLQIKLTPAKKVELQTPMSTSTIALLALFLGIDYSDKGQYAQASKMYKQALVEDPYLEMAKSGIQELSSLEENSVKEEVASVDEPLPPPATSGDEGYSTATYVGIGLAVAAAGGLVLAMSGSSSGGDDTSTVPADPSSLTVTPSPNVDTTVQCSGGSITFTFSNTMNTAAGEITITPEDFAGGSWSDSQHYVVAWDHAGSDYCTGFNSELVVVFSGVQDSSGNALSGSSRFAYNVSTD